MGKKLLGLGFVFSAIDKGVKNFLRQTSNQFEDVSKSVKHTEEALGKTKGAGLSGAMNRVVEGFKLLSLGKIASGIKGLGDKIEGLHSGSKETFQSLEMFLAELDFTQGTKSAGMLRNKLLQVSNATGTNLDQLSAAAGVMLRQGVSADQVSKALGHMGTMIGVIGVDAETLGTAMAGWTKKIGGSVEEFENLQNQAVFLQKQFKITGFAKQFAGIAEKTVEWANAMNLSKDQAEKLLRGQTVLAGAFAKTGLSSEQAARASTDFTQSMFDARKQLARMRAGLEGSLEKHKDLAIVTGDINTAFSAIQDNDPTKAFLAIGKATEKMRKSGMTDSQVHERLAEIFGEQSDLLRILDKQFPQTAAAINEANAALSDQNAAGKKGKDALNGMTKAMKGTTAWSEKQLNVLKENLGVLIRLATSGFAQRIFGAMSRGIVILMNMFTRGWKVIGPIANKIFTALESVADVVLGAGAAASGAIGGITSIVGAALMASGVFGGLFGVLGDVVGKVFGLGKGLLWLVASPFGKLLKGLGFAGAEVAEVGGAVAETAAGGSLLGKVIGFLLSPFKALGKVMMLTVTGPFKLLGKTFGLATKGFGLLGKGITKLVTGPFTFLANKFGIINKIGGVFGAVFGRLSGIFGFLLNQLKNIGLLIGRLGMMLLGTLGPIGLAVAAIAALAAGVIYLYKHWDEIFKKLPAPVQTALKAIGEQWDKLKVWMQGKWAEFVDWFPGAWNGLKKTVDEKLKAIAGVFPGIMKTIMAGVADGVAGIVDAWKGFTSWLPNALANIEKVVNRVFNFIMGKPQEAADAISGTSLFSGLDLDFSSIIDSMKSIGLEMWDALKDGVSYIVDNFPAIISSVMGVIGKIFKSALKIQLKVVTAGLHMLVKGAAVVLRNLPVIIADVIKSIIGFLKGEGGGKLGSVMTAIAHGLIDLWKEIGPDVMALVDEIWDGILEIFASALAGIDDAMNGWFSDAIDGAMGIWNGLVGWFGDMWERVREVFRSFWNGSITEDLLSWWGTLVSSGMGIFDGLVNFFPKMWHSIKDASGNAWDGIAGSISDAWDGIVGSAKKGIGKLGSLSDSLSDAASSAVDTAGTSAVVTGVVSSIRTMFSSVNDFMSDSLSSLTSSALQGVQDFGLTVVKGYTTSFDVLKEGFGAFWKWFSATSVGEMFVGMAESAADMIEVFAGFTRLGKLTDYFKKFWDFLKTTTFAEKLDLMRRSFEGLIDRTKSFMGFGNITKSFTDFITWIKGKSLGSILNDVGDMFSSMFKQIGEFTGFDQIKKKFDQISTMAKDAFAGIGDFLGIDAIEKAFTQLFDFIKAGFKSLGMFDTIADMMDSLARVADKIPGFLGGDKISKSLTDFSKSLRSPAPDVPDPLGKMPTAGAKTLPFRPTPTGAPMPQMGNAAINRPDPNTQKIADKMDDMIASNQAVAVAGAAPAKKPEVDVNVHIIGGKDIVRKVTVEQNRAVGNTLGPATLSK